MNGQTVRKAVIPAAGLGTRFLPAGKAQPKEMVPVVDKPAIQYAVEEAVRCGLHDILVVTSRGKRAIEDHFDRSVELEQALEEKGKHDLAEEMRAIAELASIHYVRQREPLGLGHAVSLARAHVGDEPFAVLLPDDVIDERVHLLEDMLQALERHGGSVVALEELTPEEVSSYGAARCEPVEERVVRLLEVIEKPSPEEAPSNLAVIGRYVFTSDVFDALDRVDPGKGGEIQLTDAIDVLASEKSAYGWVFEGGRYDTGNALAWLEANIELTLAREDLGPDLRTYLGELARREGLA